MAGLAVPLQAAHAAKKAPNCALARIQLKVGWPGATEGEIEDTLRLLRPLDYTHPTTPQADLAGPVPHYKGKLISALYITGASQGQISAVESISVQAVQNHLRRCGVPPHFGKRRSVRGLSWEYFTEVRDALYAWAREHPDEVRRLSWTELAEIAVALQATGAVQDH